MGLPKPYYETELGRLYHGDCIEIMQHIEHVDLIIIDPPYSSGARQTNQLRSRGAMIRCEKFQNEWFGTDNCSTNAFMFFMRGCAVLSFQKLKSGAHFYSFIDWRNYPILSNVLESAGIRINNLIVWDKEFFGMGNNYRQQHELVIFGSKGQPKDCNMHNLSNVIRSKRKKQENHPTEKPINIYEDFIKMSTDEGDLVVDFFMGSGTAAAACERLKRKWIGIEISEPFCEDIAKRIEGERKQLKLF